MSSISGQKTITTAGTAEPLGSQVINGPLMVKALLANTNNAYIGNDGSGDVTSADGLELDAGDAVVSNSSVTWLTSSSTSTPTAKAFHGWR